jgi:hypothetical protein
MSHRLGNPGTGCRAGFLAAGLLLAGLLLPATATAEELSVEEIVARANRAAYYQGEDGKAKVEMTIEDGRGNTRSREMTILRKDKVAEGTEGDEHSGAQYFYVYFHRPADVAKMAFMVWKHLDRDDDRWLYLPALDLVKRIAASDERTSFVGSDFFYEDVSGRGIEEDDHELAETTDGYYVVKNTPKKPQLVEFASYKMWIDRQTFLPMKAEYVDGKGKVYRRYEVLETETIQEYVTATKAKMSNLNSGGHTVLEYSDVSYNIGLPEDIFTERYLRRAPRRYLRHR